MTIYSQSEDTETKSPKRTVALTERRLQANRANSRLGGAAWSARCREEYLRNPSFCSLCGCELPQAKRNNRFCSRSCSAIFNNTGTQRAARHPCGHCGEPVLGKRIFCSRSCYQAHARTHGSSDEERAHQRRLRQREISARYRAQLRNQTPPDADLDAIREFYARCPPGYEVDHIFPISRGGSHSLDNLQYLTVTENRRKGNRMPGL